MGGIDIVLDLVLVSLLSVTLLQAVRLQRSLGALRQDRAAFESAVSGFDAGARDAEAATARLRTAADGMQAQLQAAGSLKDDLLFLSDRGERLADHLEALVRTGRGLEAGGLANGLGSAAPPPQPEPPVRSQAERSLLLALQARR